MANCAVGGKLLFGSQQQLCCRSVNVNAFVLMNGELGAMPL
jgi:hypothetical protein